MAGQLFVLVGRRTFSASMVNAIDFRRETEAILVGEPIDARPYGVSGERLVRAAQLRAASLCRDSALRFSPEGADSFHPDQPIDTSHADFVDGRDPMLEWALGAYAPVRSGMPLNTSRITPIAGALSR